MTLKKDVILSVDVMGGDFGPEVTLAGLSAALEQGLDIHFLLYGRASQVEPLFVSYPALVERSTFFPVEVAIGMDEKPSEGLMRGRRVSSMWQAIAAVKEGKADACISAGNTGVLMAMSKVLLRMIAQVERPGIAGIWPSLTGESIVLDIGASIGASERHLVNLAIMGACMARTLLGLSTARVGLLNIGVEEVKGLDEIKAAGVLLQKQALAGLEYAGFVEGNDIGSGVVDVIVTEGFTGNIALKTAEGTARQITTLLKESLGSSFISKLGYLLAYKAFNKVKDKLNPDRHNGGVLLGLDGLVIKSHGGASVSGFCSAVLNAHKMVRNGLLSEIKNELNKLQLGADQ